MSDNIFRSSTDPKTKTVDTSTESSSTQQFESLIEKIANDSSDFNTMSTAQPYLSKEILRRTKKTKELPAFSNKDQDIVSDDDWTLNTAQMLFMLQHNNAIEMAFQSDDVEYFRKLSASKEYLLLFGEMSFDEAFDRYECVLESDSGDS